MKIADKKLKKALEKYKLADQEKLKSAYKLSIDKNLKLDEVLIDEGIISDENLGKFIAEISGYKYVNLENKPINDQAFKLIPETVAKERQAIAFGLDGNKIKVAMVDPDNMETINIIQKQTGKVAVPYFATKKDIINSLRGYRRGLREDFLAMMKEYVNEAKVRGNFEDISIIKLVEGIINYAHQNKASDIHLEPRSGQLAVRYRLDGLLHDVSFLPKELQFPIISRIKVMSKMRTDEHRAAQDGKIRFLANSDSEDKEKIDIRVSIIPIIEGEKAVLRLLSAKARKLNLEDLGLGQADLGKARSAFTKPYGMILATGPTGCGKTTTLYAIIRVLNRKEVNISTIEDPVEYDIEGVNQIQVNAKSNLTFANGLRSILRQDPDIIMVGEIRDEETAGIAINSAMTGHLVLSTVHTNDAATALPRLIDMKIEPFLIASTVNLIVAQRLVRKICGLCRVSYIVSKEELKKNFSEKQIDKYFSQSGDKIRFYRGKGCQKCNGTGFVGRVGIFEALEVTEPIRKLIMRQANAEEIKTRANSEGMTTIIEDGLQKAKNGITTIEEILRATKA